MAFRAIAFRQIRRGRLVPSPNSSWRKAGLYALSAVNMALAMSPAVVWVLVFQSGSHTEGINNP